MGCISNCRIPSLRMGMVYHQTAGNDALSRPSLRACEAIQKAQ